MTFYKTVVSIEILSENEVGHTSLFEIARQIESGDWSGVYHTVSVDLLSDKEMADALIEQGSDPEFFGINI